MMTVNLGEINVDFWKVMEESEEYWQLMKLGFLLMVRCCECVYMGIELKWGRYTLDERCKV